MESGFSPLLANAFGTRGLETANKMNEILKNSYKQCSLIYNPETSNFTILNSKNIKIQDLQNIFSEITNNSDYLWKPKICNSEEDKIVKFSHGLIK